MILSITLLCSALLSSLIAARVEEQWQRQCKQLANYQSGGGGKERDGKRAITLESWHNYYGCKGCLGCSSSIPELQSSRKAAIEERRERDAFECECIQMSPALNSLSTLSAAHIEIERVNWRRKKSIWVSSTWAKLRLSGR